MHFRAEVIVVLQVPATITGPNGVEDTTGYAMFMGVNAPDISTGTGYIQEAALRPREAEGNFPSFQGVVTKVRIWRIDKPDWAPSIREKAQGIDQDGVYYSSAPVFFGETK